MYQVNFGTEARGGLWMCSDAKKRVRNVEVHCCLEVGEWETVLLEMVCGCCHRAWVEVHAGLVLMGSGVKTMASLPPLSLRCIFYKGAVTGLGFTCCCLSV